MPDLKLDSARVFGDALRSIRVIHDSVHPAATPGEKLVRIAWVIGNLPTDLREAIIGEAQRRVVSGWAQAKQPTEF